MKQSNNETMRSRRTKKLLLILALVFVLGIAAFFRFWQLDKIPPGVYPDEAMNGVNALDANKTGHYQIFYPDNNGREGLWINLIALVFKFVAPTAWSLRLLSAVFGTLTVLGLYLLTKEIFISQDSSLRSAAPHFAQNDNVKIFTSEKKYYPQYLALISAFLMAIGFWHLNFSRIAFRAILTPFLLVFCFYFLWRFFRQKRPWLLVVSAIFFGLGFHTYIAFRVAPLLLLVAWWPYLFKRPCKNYWFRFALYCLVAFLIASPIVIYFIQHPEYFMGRASDVAVWNSSSPIKDTLLSIAKTLGMFNVRGDYNWRHNFSGQPQLLWPVGIFFLVGLIYLIKNVINDLRCRCPNFFSLDIHRSIFLLAWLGLFLLPAMLTAESLPHALRALAAAPMAYVFAGLGLLLIYLWLQEKFGLFYQQAQKNQEIKLGHQIKRIKIFLAVLFLLGLATLGLFEYQKYFIKWSRRPEVAFAFTQDFVTMAEFLNFYQDKAPQRFVIVNQAGDLVNGIPMPAQTIKFLTYGQGEITYLLPEQINQINITPTKKVNALIVLMADNEGLVRQIQEKYPQNITGSETSFGEFRFISI